MRVLLDDAPLLTDAGTLGEALDRGRAEAESRGRVIVEVLADGVPTPPDDLSDAESLARPSGARELRLISADPRDLVATTFRDAAGALHDLIDTQQSIARRIQTGQSENATRMLGEVFEVWDAVRQALEQGSAMVAIDLNQDDVVADLVVSLGERLRAVVRAVESHDWSTLADELEFDLCEQAERWSAKFESLSSSLSR